jgi:hypothetical protein
MSLVIGPLCPYLRLDNDPLNLISGERRDIGTVAFDGDERNFLLCLYMWNLV